MKEPAYIGVDLGGTKIMTGAIDAKGKVLCLPIKVPTGAGEPKESLLKRLTDSIKRIEAQIDQDRFEIQAIGIGSTGPLDTKKGLILQCLQLPGMHFFPIRDYLKDAFKLPVVLNNDADCLIYGECLFGAGRGYGSIAGFTLGTGIGCAIIVNQKLWRGATGTAGEIWPSPYKDSIIEDYVSGSGVSGIYKMISGEDKTSHDIYLLAKEGNEPALRTWQKFGKHLSVALSWVVNILDPEIILLGGSITTAFEFFEESLEENFRKAICPSPAKNIRIKRAELGDDGGYMGAAIMALGL